MIVIMWCSGENSKTRLSHMLLSVGMSFIVVVVALLWHLPKQETAQGRTITDDGSIRLLLPEDVEIGPVELSQNVPVWHEEVCCGMKKRWLIPILLELQSLSVAIGSGMTFKFWPLFFEKDFDLGYIHVCMITAITWISISLFNLLCPRMVKLVGNGATTYVGLCFTATSLLLFIGLVRMPLIPTIVCVVLRNGIMNAGSPLNDSIVLNAIPRKHRAKWGSIESLSRATWAGSAFIGGMLNDSYDYRTAFTVTALIHVCAGVFYVIAIYPTVRREETVQDGDGVEEGEPEMQFACGTEIEEVRLTCSSTNSDGGACS